MDQKVQKGLSESYLWVVAPVDTAQLFKRRMGLIAKINKIINIIHLPEQGAGKFFPIFKLVLVRSFKNSRLDRMHTLVGKQQSQVRINAILLLTVNEKYYVANHGVREAVFGGNMKDINLVLENIVYMELLRRGYQAPQHLGLPACRRMELKHIGL